MGDRSISSLLVFVGDDRGPWHCRVLRGWRPRDRGTSRLPDGLGLRPCRRSLLYVADTGNHRIRKLVRS